MTTEMKEIRGWTLLRSEREWRALRGGSIVHPKPPCYPCLVKERILSDESAEYEYLTQGMLADMTRALTDVGTGVPGLGVRRSER